MGLFSTTNVVLVCDRCGSLLAYATQRTLPARLDLNELDGTPLAAERGDLAVQRMDAGILTVDPARSAQLRHWLNRNAIELVYDVVCPRDGRVWMSVPDIATSIRRAPAGTTATVPVH